MQKQKAAKRGRPRKFVPIVDIADEYRYDRSSLAWIVKNRGFEYGYQTVAAKRNQECIVVTAPVAQTLRKLLKSKGY